MKAICECAVARRGLAYLPERAILGSVSPSRFRNTLPGHLAGRFFISGIFNSPLFAVEFVGAALAAIALAEVIRG